MMAIQLSDQDSIIDELCKWEKRQVTISLETRLMGCLVAEGRPHGADEATRSHYMLGILITN